MDYEIGILGKLVSRPTVSGDEAAARGMAALLEKELKAIGAKVSIVDPKRDGATKASWPNVIADFDLGKKDNIVINCHYDVVPPGDGWLTDPFRLVAKKNRFYGRGTIDDKGPVAITMGAVREAAGGGSSKYNIRLMLTCDEEIGSRYGVEYVLRKGLGKGVDFALIMDGHNHPVVGCSGGVDGKIRVYGRQSHAGAEWKGKNAISESFALLGELERGFKKIRARRRSVLELSEKDAPYKNVFGRFNITMIRSGEKANVIPGLCEASFDMRLLPEENADDAVRELRAYLSGLSKKLGIRSSMEVDLKMNGYISDSKNRFVKRFMDVCGERRRFGTWGVVDGRLFAERGVPSVAYGPSDGYRDHTANEYIEREEIESTKKMLLKFLEGG